MIRHVAHTADISATSPSDACERRVVESPVPWISTELWQREWIDAQLELARECVDEPGKSDLDEGLALYHCRACGRVYLGSFHP